MGLFQKKPPTSLQVAEAHAERVRAALDQARTGVDKIATQHEAALAAVDAHVRAVEDARAAAVVTIGDGAAMPSDELDVLDAKLQRAQRDESIVRAALEQKRDALQPLIAANDQARQHLHLQHIKAATDVLESALVSLVEANNSVAAITNTMRGDPNFTLAWANSEALSNWQAARRRWLGIAEPGDGPFLA